MAKKLRGKPLFKDSPYFIGEKRRTPLPPLSGGVIKRETKIQTLTQSARSYQLHVTRLNVKKNEDYAR